MNILNKTIIFITYTVCTVVLLMSIYPGFIDSLLFPTLLVIVFSIPILIIPVLFLLIIFIRRGIFKKIKLSGKLIKPILLILLITAISLKFYIPLRLAFAVSQSDFDRFISKETRLPIGKLGFYHIDQYIKDSTGGKYFRVNYRGEGLSPDIVSYGFTYQPNSRISPFGNADYQIFHLNGDWYWFQTSNDY